MEDSDGKKSAGTAMSAVAARRDWRGDTGSAQDHHGEIVIVNANANENGILRRRV